MDNVTIMNGIFGGLEINGSNALAMDTTSPYSSSNLTLNTVVYYELNGNLVARRPEYTDTVQAGTYNFANGTWSNTATYSISLEEGVFKVSGQIPYGSANALFPTPGYRFAVKISRSIITSMTQLPMGDIVKITNTDGEGQYFTYTRDSFETDGSLIVIIAPNTDNIDVLREVKIAWWFETNEMQDSDFTTYTFDLSDTYFAPVPVVIETERSVALCITPRVQSDKLIKIRVPEGGLYAGQVVNCVELETTVDVWGLNESVYLATMPTNDTVDSQFIAVIVNGGIEELGDGRRPSGNPDYTKYKFKEGEVVDAILFDKNLIFEISSSVVSGGSALDISHDIGKYIVAVGETNNPAVYEYPTKGGCLQIIGTTYFRCADTYQKAPYSEPKGIPVYVARGYR